MGNLHRRLVCTIVPCLALGVVHARALTFDERVKAQEAIEQVYWAHRIWPRENSQPKPSLEAVLPEFAIRARVEDYLKKANALEKFWKRPITAKQLQAEMDRMAEHTRDPKVLGELFAALGSDPYLIAETLARQTLADRLIRDWYAHDTRFHGDLRKKAEAALAACKSAACMKSMGGEYRETMWKLRRQKGDRSEDESSARVRALYADDWTKELQELSEKLGGSPESLPVGRTSCLEETPEGFVVTAVLSQAKDEVTTASAVWRKWAFNAWWAAERGSLSSRAQETSGTFILTSLPQTGCTNDTWTRTQDAPPDARNRHTAVWTGAEMIIAGGDVDSNGYHRSGGRYNPSTDSWVAISPLDGRFYHTAVWTGTEMIIWGGFNYYDYLKTGGRYDPSTDTWVVTSTGANVPAARGNHTAVWTGTVMIIWGGAGGSSDFNTGGRYDPSTDSWAATSTSANVPSGRRYHTAVWSGTEMIVWGGQDDYGSPLNTGGRYDPFTDIWTTASTGAGLPGGRYYHTAVWTGTEMIVWGGWGNTGYLKTGGRYDPSTDTWVATSTGANAPSGRQYHTAVWSGTEMIVWGGEGNDANPLNTGGRYNPSTDTWNTTSSGPNVPVARYWHTAVWTGTEMIVWGGFNGGSLNTGGRFDPSSDTWTATSTGVIVPSPRYYHTAVWTGAEMVVWGGFSSIGKLNTGAQYDPSTDSWAATSTGANVPSGREYHTAVWSGTEMIVWGGDDDNPSSSNTNTGGRYNPSTDTWVTTSTGANVPSGRRYHTAVWSGTEMIVWGGEDQYSLSNTGGRYNPFTDTWVVISTGEHVPSGRKYHTAVWSGTKMIVWGGWGIIDVWGSTGYLNTGGRYNPSTDTWVATSTGANVPVQRDNHTAVWTGTEMIIWGGSNYDGQQHLLNTGSRYSPSMDTWVETSTGANVPVGREYHAAVWTGAEMIVWGGGLSAFFSSMNTGGRYDPSADSWLATSTEANVPPGREYHTAIWTGMEMIVWGGTDSTNGYMSSGGRYCAPCLDCRTVYGDSDGDGYGNPASTISTRGSIPSGYVAENSDCNDADASIHPGAPEVCNGIDDDCDGTVDEGLGQTTCGVGACQRTVNNCVNGSPQTCTPDIPTAEVCNGIDDNCDGTVDEGPPKPVLARDLRLLADRQTLTWTAGSGVSGWDVVKGDLGLLHASGGDFTASLLACVELDSPDAASSDPAVPPAGEGFYYLVRARDTCGQLGSYNDGAPSQKAPRDPGIDSNPFACSCPACTPLPPLSVPSNVSTCAGHCQGMIVRWSANPAAERVSRYRIRYGTVSGALHDSVVAPDDFIFISGLLQTLYYFQVRAEDEAGNLSDWGPEVSALVRDDISPTLTTPSSVTQDSSTTSGGGTAAVSNQINLSWPAVTTNVETISCDPSPTLCRDLQGYRIYKGTTGGSPPPCPGGGPIVDETTQKTTTYSDTAVVNCRNYYYCLNAVDLCGHVSVDWPNAIWGHASTTTPPAAPTGVTASRTGSTTAVVNWNAVTQDVSSQPIFIDTYEVWRSIVPTDGADPNTSTYHLVATVGPPTYPATLTTTYTDTSVPSGSSNTPYYKIKAKDDCLNISAFSSPPVAAPCPFNGTVTISPPTGSSLAQGPQTITVTYSGSETLVSCQLVIQKSTGGVDFNQTQTGPGPVYTFTWTPSSTGSFTAVATVTNSPALCTGTATSAYTVYVPPPCCLSVNTANTTYPGSGNARNQMDFILTNVGSCASSVNITQMVVQLNFDQDSCDGLPDLSKVESPSGTTLFDYSPGLSLPATADLSPALTIANNSTAHLILTFSASGTPTYIQNRCVGTGGNITRRDRIASDFTFTQVSTGIAGTCSPIILNTGLPTP